MKDFKLDDDLRYWVLSWSWSKEKSIEQTINELLREKMKSDTENYIQEIEEQFK